jgi:S1-C subfamily serine protease
MANEDKRTGGAASSLAPEERDVPNLIERATVFVLAISSKKDDVRSGTGFFVSPGIILTNSHVVGESSAKLIVLNKTLGGPRHIQNMTISKKADRDYALLRIGKPPSGYPSHLAFNNDAKRTDRVGAWGFPGAVIKNDPMFAAMLRGDMRSAPEVVYSEGVISTIQKHDPPLIVHTAIISHGNSGGPLVNTKGQVLGINTAIFLDNQTYRQSGVAISASDIIRFMREHSINPLIAPD